MQKRMRTTASSRPRHAPRATDPPRARSGSAEGTRVGRHSTTTILRALASSPCGVPTRTRGLGAPAKTAQQPPGGAARACRRSGACVRSMQLLWACCGGFAGYVNTTACRCRGAACLHSVQLCCDAQTHGCMQRHAASVPLTSASSYLYVRSTGTAASRSPAPAALQSHTRG